MRPTIGAFFAHGFVTETQDDLMSRHLHDPKDPRHSRLFELLRQGERAADVAAPAHKLTFRKATPEEVEMIKLSAAKTLQRPN